MTTTELFSPLTRGKICSEILHSQAHAWRGTRQGVTAEIKLSDYQNPKHERVYWSAEYRDQKASDTAATVYEAIRAIETFVEKERSR